MSDLVHNFAAQKQKRDARFKQVVDTIPEVARGEGLDVQAIVISGSPEMGSNDQPETPPWWSQGRPLQPPVVIQVIHPHEQALGRPERSLYI